jgi:hypothetical protein
MTAGDRAGSSSHSISFDLPFFSVLRRSNRAGSGSSSMTVHGSNIGHAGVSNAVRDGFTGCEATEWESETALRCRVGHGVRGTRRVSLTAGSQWRSASHALSYDAPSLYSLLTERSIGW